MHIVSESLCQLAVTSLQAVITCRMPVASQCKLQLRRSGLVEIPITIAGTEYKKALRVSPIVLKEGVLRLPLV
jgi:hypothetical protein